MIQLTWGAATDPGRTRAHNEDAMLTGPCVFAVADGMGGHRGGARAAAVAVSTLATLNQVPGLAPDDVVEALRAAHQSVQREGTAPELRGLGTTAVGLAAVRQSDAQYWLAFNVGDSRLYSLHQGDFVQVSVDHSQVQELVDHGRITPEQARTHPERNVITRSIGAPEPIDPDLWILPARAGERFLLCSDGLTTEVDDETIHQTLVTELDPNDAAHRLVELALASGGRDNVSVIVLDTGPEDEPTVDDTLETTRPRGLPVVEEIIEIPSDLIGDGSPQPATAEPAAPPQPLIDGVPGASD